MSITDTIRRQFQKQFGVSLQRKDPFPGVENHRLDPTWRLFGRGHPCFGPEISAKEKDKENLEFIERLTRYVPKSCK